MTEEYRFEDLIEDPIEGRQEDTEIQVCRRLHTPLINLITQKIHSEKGYDNHALSVEKLTLVVIELIKSNNKLRADVKELKRWVHDKKRKIVVIDWLNINLKPKLNYKEFISELSITRVDLEYVFKMNYVDGIKLILQNYMSNFDENDIPFKSFDIKNDVIYVYKIDGDDDAGKDESMIDTDSESKLDKKCKWEILSSIDFNNIVSIISKGILVEFKKWQDENEYRLYTDEFSIIYVQNVKKVMGGDIPIEKLRDKIHKNLYKCKGVME
jgi:uncharacterized protein YeeX (DUF496 family)